MMPTIDRLYTLEIEFHRRFRSVDVNSMEARGIHTSYALQNGYEPLLRAVGIVDSLTLAESKNRLIASGDPRDVLAAYHSLRQLIKD